jgi:hypothetical protein
MLIYLDPRVIEGTLLSLDNYIRHHTIVSTMNGLEHSVLENRLKTTVEELKNLSVKFNTFKHNLEHSLTQHLHPQQLSGQPCECPHAYFCSGGQCCLSSVGGVAFAAHCNNPFPRSPNSTGSSSSSTNAESESDIMPPLEEVTSGSGSSEEEGDGSEGKEDWQSAGEERGDLGRAAVNTEASGDKTWNFLVCLELDPIVSEWGIPRNHHDCKDCFQHPSSKWDFCHLSNYSLYVPFHECPLFQSCDC